MELGTLIQLQSQQKIIPSEITPAEVVFVIFFCITYDNNVLA